MNDATKKLVQKLDASPHGRLQIGSCDWVNCDRPAYYEIDMDCDDESAFLCEAHYDTTVVLLRPWMPTLFKCEDDE